MIKLAKKIHKRKKELEVGLIGLAATGTISLFLKYIIAPVVKKLWIHEVQGLEHIPKNGPVIVASNHESYFDFICFYAISPRKIQYLAAEKFYDSKFWKPLMIATGQIKVERSAKDKSDVHKKAHCILKNEGALGIFPEGTRSRTGELGPAYPGVTRFALETKAPIVPVGMIDTFHILPPHKKWPSFTKKCKIKISPPIHHHEHYDKEHTEELVKKLTDDLMLHIGSLVGKEYKHHYSLKENKKYEKVIEGELV